MKFKDQNYTDQEIQLDSNEFNNCTFTRCIMIYSGSGKVGMVGCTFNDVKWTFSGAAANTIQFMTALYKGAGEGGKQLVEKTFDNIRQGVSPIA